MSLKRALVSETTRKIAKYPCFNKEASFQYGRIHLQVVPDCNVQCNFYLREFDCVNKSGADPHAVKELNKSGIELIEDYSPVETAINRLVKYFMK